MPDADEIVVPVPLKLNSRPQCQPKVIPRVASRPPANPATPKVRNIFHSPFASPRCPGECYGTVHRNFHSCLVSFTQTCGASRPEVQHRNSRTEVLTMRVSVWDVSAL